MYLARAGIGNLGLEYQEVLHCPGTRVSCAVFPNLSRLLYPAERGGFLQGKGAIVAEFGNVLTELLQTGWLTRWVWRN